MVVSQPGWMKGRPDVPDFYDDDDDEPVGLTLCVCGGEGCDRCDTTGVIYP